MKSHKLAIVAPLLVAAILHSAYGIDGPAKVGYGELVVLTSDIEGTWDILHPDVPFKVTRDNEMVFASGLLDLEILCVLYHDANRGDFLRVEVSGDAPPIPRPPEPRPTPPTPPRPDPDDRLSDTARHVRDVFAAAKPEIRKNCQQMAEIVRNVTSHAMEDRVTGIQLPKRVIVAWREFWDDLLPSWDSEVYPLVQRALTPLDDLVADRPEDPRWAPIPPYEVKAPDHEDDVVTKGCYPTSWAKVDHPDGWKCYAAAKAPPGAIGKTSRGRWVWKHADGKWRDKNMADADFRAAVIAALEQVAVGLEAVK